MTDCSSVNASSLSGTGTAGKKWKAIGRAIKSLKQVGKNTCIGGQCSTFGQSCSFDPGEISITVKSGWTDDEPARLVYEATATSTGGRCQCS